MSDRGVHHILVVAGARLLGSVSMSDILPLSHSEFSGDGSLSDALLDERCTLGRLMNRSPVTIDDGASLQDAARAMSLGDFHSLPVVDADRNLVGIVTSTYLIRYLVGDLLPLEAVTHFTCVGKIGRYFDDCRRGMTSPAS